MAHETMMGSSPTNSKQDAKLGKKKLSLSAWDKLKYALGGEENMEGLVESVQRGRSTLQLLLDMMNLKSLQSLKEK